jgi:MFS family permease
LSEASQDARSGSSNLKEAGGLGTAQVVATVAMTLTVQALTSLALAVPAVLAPVAAADLGVAPTGIGNWVGFAYLVAMFAGLASGALVGRHGSVRVLEAAALCVALGLAVGAEADLALILACGILLGTAHGLVNPASSAILAAASPPQARSMIFSIKQTGVPIGGATAGMLVPAMLLWTSWQHTVLLLAAVSAAFIAMIVPFRAIYDRGPRSAHRFRLSQLGAPIAEVRAHRPILELALASAVYSSVQMSFGTYLVSYLKIGLGYSLIAAGLIFSAAQLAGVFGRILWGVVADRLFKPRPVLAVLGVAMALCGMGSSLFAPGWPVAAVTAVCVLYGATAVGWNGVFLAEVARLAPEGRVAIITGGTQFFTFSGVLIGPPVFGLIASATGSYGAGFILFAVLPLIMGVGLLLSARRASQGRA